MTGVAAGGKPINLGQLQTELETAGTTISPGLGADADWVYTYNVEGEIADFSAADQPKVEQAIASHVAMRDKTDAELSAEFQATTDPGRRQEIRDMQSGLIPREQVPM